MAQNILFEGIAGNDKNHHEIGNGLILELNRVKQTATLYRKGTYIKKVALSDKVATKLLVTEMVALGANKTKLTLSALNGILADTLDEELIQLMKAAGFEWLNIPLVSGSPEIQENLNRNQSREKFSTTVSWAQKYGLKVVAYLILGLPEDTLDQMLDDILFLAELPVLIGPSIFYPPPGSVTFTDCVKKGLITGTDFSRYRSSAFSVETENFSRQDLMTLFRIVRVINFLKKLIDEHLSGDQHLARFIRSLSIDAGDLKFKQKLSQEQIGILLIEQLWRHQKLRGLRLKNQSRDDFEYDWIDYKITPDIVTRFITKIDNKTIAGIAKPFQMTLSN